MRYKDMKKDCAYCVTKSNTDGGIFIGDVIYIDSQDDSLVLSGCGWYSKDDELLDKNVTDFECEAAEDLRVFKWGGSRGIISKKRLEETLAGSA